MRCELSGLSVPKTYEMGEFDMMGTMSKMSSEPIHRMATEGGGR